MGWFKRRQRNPWAARLAAAESVANMRLRTREVDPSFESLWDEFTEVLGALELTATQQSTVSSWLRFTAIWSESNHPSKTKLVGKPLLEANDDWPNADGVPMRFVAQLATSKLNLIAGDDALPEEHLLSFFCAPDGSPEDAALLLSSVVSAVEREPPYPAKPELPCELLRRLSLPGGDVRIFDDDELERVVRSALQPLFISGEVELGCRSDGHATPLQADIERRLFLEARGLWGDEPEAPDIETCARLARDEWQLLFQFQDNSYSEPWHGAALYFFIKREDLLELDFGGALAVRQNT